MNERMKVLELLQDGKITVEQAAELLAAIDEKNGDEKSRREFPFGWTFPRKSGEEWKTMTSQIKASVQQHLDELKKNIDLDDWSFKSTPRIAVTVERALSPDSTHVTVETKNGRIRASRWDGDYVRIRVRGYVKAENAEEARRTLDAAMAPMELDGRYELTIQPTRETGETNVEIYLPQNLKQLKMHSHNGGIRADEIQLEELTVDAHNGSIVVYHSAAERVRLLTHNGNIDIQHSVIADSRSVYATTYNGTIDIDGIAADALVSGTAKSRHGRIEISGDRLTVDYDNPQQRQHARFRTAGDDAGTKTEVQLFVETNNGLVVVRA